MKEVAERMGSRSKNAYAQYEQGKILPSFDKLTQILQAIDPGLDLVFRVRKLA